MNTFGNMVYVYALHRANAKDLKDQCCLVSRLMLQREIELRCWSEELSRAPCTSWYIELCSFETLYMFLGLRTQKALWTAEYGKKKEAYLYIVS